MVTGHTVKFAKVVLMLTQLTATLPTTLYLEQLPTTRGWLTANEALFDTLLTKPYPVRPLESPAHPRHAGTKVPLLLAKAGPVCEHVVATMVEAVPLEAHAPIPPKAVRVTSNAAGKLMPSRVQTTEAFFGATVNIPTGTRGMGSGAC